MPVTVTEAMLDAGFKMLGELQPVIQEFVGEAEIKQNLGMVFKAMCAAMPAVLVPTTPASAPAAE